jgi:hypothetical protein
MVTRLLGAEVFRCRAYIACGSCQRWTAAARLQAVIATAAMDESSRNAWCREQGPYSSELDTWKRGAIVGLGEPRVASAAEARQDREQHRTDKALAETSRLASAGKKLKTVFHDCGDV